MVFGGYASYYDIFYAQKDYALECQFVLDLLKSLSAQEIHSILDLGCGTGGHVLPLARRGYEMTGVDLSGAMIEQARSKSAEANLAADFHLGDIRSVDLGRTFDAVISMFAVMGYQISNGDFFSAMRVARKHLESGGLFVFDAWFGPAVLRERPETRVREIPDGAERILRVAAPELNPLANTVTVHYTVLRLAGDRVLDETHESHPMRFLFAPEVAFFAEQTGFEVLKLCPFLEPDREPNDRDWNVTWVLRAA
jgi:SAM-dependent methyltransferase